MQKSQTIELLRFPLAILIIFIHFGGNSFDSSLQEFGALWFIHTDANVSFRMIFSILSKFAVPVFFFISGYLFFIGGNFDKDIYARKLKSRIYTLLIPYLLWNIIRFVVEMPFEGVCSWRMIFFAPSNGQFWFVRDLIYLSILSPIIFWIIKRIGFVFPFLFFILEAANPLNYGIHDGFLMMGSVLYFSIGACFSIKKIYIEDLFLCNKIISFALLIAYIVFNFLFAFKNVSVYVSSAFLLAAIPGIFNTVNVLCSSIKKFLIKYACTSFFIFASHKIVGMGLSLCFKVIGLGGLYKSDYFFPIRISLIAFACVAMYYFLEKYCSAIVFRSLAGTR